MGLTRNHVRPCQGICSYNILEKQPAGRLLVSIQKQGMFLQLFRNGWKRKVHAAEGLVVYCFIAHHTGSLLKLLQERKKSSGIEVNPSST